MPKQQNIVIELENLIKKEEKKDDDLKLNVANELYNRLVKEGTIKKRGYTLRGIEDYKLIRHSLNK